MEYPNTFAVEAPFPSGNIHRRLFWFGVFECALPGFAEKRP
jgi:hypothetical protein